MTIDMDAIARLPALIAQIETALARVIPPSDPARLLLRADEVASLTGYSVKTIYKYAGERRIPTVNIDGTLFFDPTDLRAWIDAHRVPAIPRLETRRRTA
jgi:predicted DNA-binding transcriptional regulator AlpA